MQFSPMPLGQFKSFPAFERRPAPEECKAERRRARWRNRLPGRVRSFAVQQSAVSSGGTAVLCVRLAVAQRQGPALSSSRRT